MPDLKARLLSKRIDWQCIEEQLNDRFKVGFDEAANADYQTKMMYVFETVHLPGLLSRVDTTTMATSVEARVPFVDHRLVEFAFSIPNKYKLKWNSRQDEIDARDVMSDAVSERFDTPKYVLKKAGERYLPNNILCRKKMAFPVPLDKWLGGQFSMHAQQLLCNENNVANEVIDADFILSLFGNEGLANDHSLAMNVWMVLNLFVFCQVYDSYLEPINGEAESLGEVES